MEQALDWIQNNLALVAIIISSVAAIGAIYPLMKDFIPWLLNLMWDIFRMLCALAWWMLTPIRKPLAYSFIWAFDKIIESRASSKK